jgi:hypothetical protein
MNNKDIENGCMDLFYLTQDWDQQQMFMNVVMNLWGPQRVGNS